MRFLVCLAVLLCGAARAATFEIGVEAIKAETVSNGFWYEADKPHSLHLTVPGISLGIAGDHWKVAYVRSGTFRSDAIAFASDAPNLARYVGHGRYDGLQATVDSHHILIGALLYVPRWEEHTDEGGRLGFWPNRPNLHIAPVVGLVLHRGRFSVSLTETFACISDRCESGVWPPIWRNLTTLSVYWRLHGT